MNKLFVLAFLISFLMSCSESSNNRNGYHDFQNDWQRYDLYGKVKKVVFMYPKEDYHYADSTRTLWKRKVQEFSKEGFLLKDEDYFFGDRFTKGVYYTYGEDNELIKTFKKSIDYQSGQEYTETEERVAYDREKRMRTFKKYNNGELQHTKNIYYDSNDYKIKILYTEPGRDSSTLTFVNQYSDEDQLIYQIAEYNFSPNDTIKRRTYDSQGRLIKESNKFHHSEYTYEGAILVKENKYDTYKSGKKFNLETIKYNKSHFPVYEFFTSNHTLTFESKYEYKYDEKGNWIQQIVYDKSFSEPFEYKKDEENIRKITYW